MRYQCGHLSCQNCAAIEESCHICLSQQNSSTHLDEPYGLRVKHVSELITTFEDAFNVDGIVDITSFLSLTVSSNIISLKVYN